MVDEAILDFQVGIKANTSPIQHSLTDTASSYLVSISTSRGGESRYVRPHLNEPRPYKPFQSGGSPAVSHAESAIPTLSR